MSIRRIIPLSAFAVLLGSGLTYAAPVVLLDDQFNDLGRTNGADANDAAWFLYANTTPVGNASSGSFVASSGANSSTGFNPGFSASFPTHTVATGETITFSFNFSSQGSDGQNAIRFGLYNQGTGGLSGDVGVPNNNANPGATFQDDIGYSVFAPHKVTGAVQLFERTPTNSGAPLPISVARNTAIGGASTNLATPTNAVDTYLASLSLTRTATGYDYAVNFATASFSGSTTTFSTDTFNAVTIWGINTTSQTFTIDNVSVTTVVPEPGTFGLLAAGAGLLLRRRRSV